MKDFLGQELIVGDTVVMIKPDYRELIKAVISKFTKQMVVVTYEYTYWDRWFGNQTKSVEIRQAPHQLVKVNHD